MTWTWWMTLAVILAVLLLIGCIPVGVDAAYGEGGIRLAVKIWLFRLQLLPQKPKKKKKPAKKAAPKQKKPAPEKPAGEKKPNPLLSGGVDGILELLDLGVQTLGDLRRPVRRVRVHNQHLVDHPALLAAVDAAFTQMTRCGHGGEPFVDQDHRHIRNAVG